MLCGACHADVERMNPYGLLTDQLASYWVSGHGKRLKQSGDTRVAVCIDCHGAHDVLRHDNPQSRTYFRNVPQTCARCHSDRALMGEFNLNPDVFDQYRLSVHGKNVLERGDSGSPTCATCHGSHAAAPPGYLEVSHVCGRCHKQIEDYFLTSIHGRIPVMARCIGCHGRDGDRRNHQIGEASPPVEVVMQAYVTARAESGDSAEALRSRFTENLNAQAGSLRLDVVCATCHSPARRRDPHSIFFESSDKTAREFGNELAATLRDAQFDYARTAERVQRLSRGVLLLKDEALRIEDAKTEVMALTAFIHTLNRTEIVSRGQKVRDICKEVDDALDIKETGVVRWRMASLPIWAFIAVFAVLMYRKYLELRRAYVTAPGLDAAAHPAPAVLSPGRRHFFDAILATMGSVTLVGLLWPAVAYVLPVGKRGGAVDRVSAGKAEGWATWQSRKISVTGKPVVVVRNDQGFAAYSAVCTHLGCIVHWNESKREFECPCHAARFDAQGQVLAGPPPTPLPPYSATVVQGEVIVAPAKTS
jgi:cytochrome b6-f complex iron-sulfur subunit